MEDSRHRLLHSLRAVRGFRWACRLLLWLGILLFGAALYAAVFGFPSAVADRVREEFAKGGYEIRFERIRLDFVEGIVADRVQLYLDERDLHPALEARELVLGFDPRAWLRRDAGLQRVRIKDGLFRLSSDGVLTEAEGPRLLAWSGIFADVRLEEGGVRLARLRSKINGVNVRGKGFVIRDPDRVREPGHQAARPKVVQDFIVQSANWLPALVEEFNAVEFPDESLALLDFILHPTNRAVNAVQVVVEGRETRIRGLLFDGWGLDIEWGGDTLELKDVSLWRGPNRFKGRARLQVDRQELEASLFSDLQPVYWKNLMPDAYREFLEQGRVHFAGDTVIELTLGPIAVTQALEQVRGRMAANQVDAHGVWLESLTCNVERDANQLRMTNIHARIGLDNQQGEATGDITLDLDTKAYRGSLDASFDPNSLVSVVDYSDTLSRIIRSLTFPDSPPSVKGGFSGRLRSGEDGPAFNFAGSMESRAFHYYGSYIEQFEAGVRITNRTIRMDPLLAVRREGRLEGSYFQDFGNRTVDIDVISTIDPRALGRLGDTAIEPVLRPFRFDGPVNVTVKGRVDYGDGHDTDYRARAEAEGVSWRWLTADNFSCDWIAEGDRVHMTNILITLYSGMVGGHVELSGVGTGEVWYEMDGRARDVSFSDLLSNARQIEEDTRSGDLSASLSLRGRGDDDWRTTIAGEGRLRIREGHIFRIPLLGGMSQLLQRIYPGLGYFTQSDVRADFVIADQKIESDDIRVEGHIISLKGWGHYHLDDKLDFRVQVQPLRRGRIVDAVRIVTTPVSKLLQLRLQGTLAVPDWRVEYAPTEWFGIFERWIVEEE